MKNADIEDAHTEELDASLEPIDISSTSVADELLKLRNLRDERILSAKEFFVQIQKILS